MTAPSRGGWEGCHVLVCGVLVCWCVLCMVIAKSCLFPLFFFFPFLPFSLSLSLLGIEILST